MKYLSLLDTDKIKDYIFETGKLKLIRGASTILAELNEKAEVEKRVEKLIYAGGGGIMASFETDQKAADFIKSEKKLYEQKYASITGVFVPENGNFKETVRNGQRELKKAKEEKRAECLKEEWDASQLPTSPFFKFCDFCGENPSNQFKHQSAICDSCLEKLEKGEEIRKNPIANPIYNQLVAYIKEKKPDSLSRWQDAEFFEGLSELGECSTPKNYIGFIYADGNRMGERLQSIDSSEEYTEFSQKVDSNLKTALFEAIIDTFPDGPIESKIPFEPVLLGGDDLIFITLANKAMPIALKTAASFEKATGIAISTGVVIAHSKYPIYSFLRLAEELLKSAKTLSKESWYPKPEGQRKEVSTIDYLVVSSPSARPLKIIRDEDISFKTEGGEKLRLFQRPFTLEKMEKLIDHIKALKDLPRGRLYSIYNSLLRGKNQGIFDYLALKRRLREESQRDILKNLEKDRNFFNAPHLCPWQKVIEDGESYSNTPFLDLLELYDFIEKGDS